MYSVTYESTSTCTTNTVFYFCISHVEASKIVEIVERTAFLEDGLEFVHITEVYSPDHFYVQG